jgi:hypothetical protein
MNKLLALVAKHKAAKYGIPPNQGWLTRQQAARQLGTTDRNVHDLLRDAIEAKDIECKKFSDWDAASMRPVQVTCYRILADLPEKKSPTKKSTPPAAVGPISAELRSAVLAAHKRHPHLPGRRLREYLPPRLRRASTGDQVLEILAKA